ncbi:hypothetical protein [Azorhizobium]|uniref:Uncharacterized protein n=1 Tax=Azorhizobium caulinodans (strain ATCC 43989 / DSM 5975 / JCM 20966 / LMG 6465 / NBRC 14845 / NCIMB 13405 / ORS 571) TaxID=438753 RepID=A8I4K3_AZOC5|nr:hypothetical protein [Azorhizobium]TDT94756.1 hypothetical protein DFO45_2511 [Azorhizobium sp. AG788]BAF87740.1 hypothetical protein AZC_1742 [Azorhizobium caulinodans ORS 571]
MAVVALIVLFLALASAVASWGVAVTEGLKAKGAAEAAGGSHGSVSMAHLVLWPFAARLLSGPAADPARRVGKAQVAFIAALMIAVAAVSVYTNLSAVRPPSAAPAAPGAAPSSKS